jgi:DNA processing protein
MCIDAWLTLIQSAPPGSARVVELLRSLGGISRVINLSRLELLEAGLHAETVQRLKSPDRDLVTSWQRWLAPVDRALVTLGSPNYPPLLETLPDPPLALWVRGTRLDLLRAPQLAMVGSRNPTHNGLETAKRFARYFSDQGLTITSGMATGIDTACHRGALVGTARTIAVLGSGPDVIFPQANDLLAQSIIAEGLLISEYPPGTPARSIHFPQRNRIIAGLSVGTMVVEAAHRSGSLITARLAGEYGREIFAIPGSIHSPLAKGCHRLIKDGAKLVENAADVLVELSSLLQFVASNDIPEEREKAAPHSLTEQPGYSELLDAMDFSPSVIGNISARAGLTTAEVSSMLLILELEGFVEALPGGLYSRLPKRSA